MTGRYPCLIVVAMAVPVLCVPVDAQRETAADVRLQAEAGDAERHVLAIILAISVPPAVLPWFVVHGFIAFWRRLGATATYVIMMSGYVAIAAGLYAMPNYGTIAWMLVFGGLSADVPPIADLRERASQLEATISEAERRASMHIATTPSTTVRAQPLPRTLCAH